MLLTLFPKIKQTIAQLQCISEAFNVSDFKLIFLLYFINTHTYICYFDLGKTDPYVFFQRIEF